MLVIGLTGGIGSGKTTVANLFAKKGVPLIDTDIIARQLTTKGQPFLTQIAEHFGPSLIHTNGELNRAALRNIVFKDDQKRLWLEQLLHPKIKEQMKLQLESLSTPYAIAIIPLLFETEFQNDIHRSLVIDTPENTQIKRVMLRDHLTEDQVKAIIRSQATRENRLAHAHDVITNDNNLAHLRHQVNQLHEKYMKLAAKQS